MHIKKTAQLACLLFVGCISANAVAQNSGYSGVYKQGLAPLKKNARVHFVKVDDGYEVQGMGNSSGVWSLPLKSIRGAQVSSNGLWLYWFDDQDNTLHGFFKMDAAAGQQLASELNGNIQDYYSASKRLEEYKDRYEAYKEEALKQAQ